MGIFNSLIAYVSNAMPLSTSVRYQKSIFLLHKSAVVFSIFFIDAGTHLPRRTLQIS